MEEICLNWNRDVRKLSTDELDFASLYPSLMISALTSPIEYIPNFMDNASWRFVYAHSDPWCELPPELYILISTYLVDAMVRCNGCTSLFRLNDHCRKCFPFVGVFVQESDFQ